MTTSSPVLSICIPTYNRNKDLTARLVELQSIESLFISGLVEVCVQDNSTQQMRELNCNICSYYHIKYESNHSNIGLGGSIYRLTERSTGRFILFLSDNDKIITENLVSILNNLKNQIKISDSSNTRLPLYMVPFNNSGTIRYDILPTPPASTLNECLSLNPSRFPGCLLSSCIIPNNRVSLGEHKHIIVASIFPQIIIIFLLITGSEQVSWSRLPVVHYFSEQNPRFKILEVIASEIETIDVITSLNDVVASQSAYRKKKALISLLINCYWFRIGKVQLAFTSRLWQFNLIYFLIQNFQLITPKSFALLLVVLVPFPRFFLENLKNKANDT